jgi:hypothetical protein
VITLLTKNYYILVYNNFRLGDLTRYPLLLFHIAPIIMCLSLAQLDLIMTIHHNANSVITPPLPDDGEIPSVGGAQINRKLDKLPNGTAGHTNGISSSGKYAIPLNPQLAFTPRKIRVITIGAGYSGLIIAHKFQHRFPEMQKMVEHKIFEARSDVGGTWLVNTYPGVQCDVPAQIYVCHEIQYL